MQRLAGKHFLQAPNGPLHLGQTTRMEQLTVQVMRIAVIAQIEAHDVEPQIKKLLRERQNIERFGVALPAMDEDRDPRGARDPAARWIGMETLQAHAVATIEENLTARGAQCRRAWHHPAPPHRQARQNGLQMAITQPSRRTKIVVYN